MSYCHGQALLDRAADGRDYPEPFFTLAGAAADGAQGDPATGLTDDDTASRGVPYETKTAPANSPFPQP